MRFAGKKKFEGKAQLRLDVFSFQNGWSYHSREINIGEGWSHFEASVLLASNAVSVYPTLSWNPSSEGCALEMRSPTLRWITYETH